MSKFGIEDTPLEGLRVLQRLRIEDSRGFFSRFFCADELRVAGWESPIAQINHTLTRRKGSVRGLHFQYPPHMEEKVVSCVAGEIFDVAVDLRRDSPTFLQWHGEMLSAQNARSLLIPRGFAHGFQSMSDGVELLYLHSTSYAPLAEGALNIGDPRLAINWPLPFGDLSERDANHAFIDEDFMGVAA